jgi:CDP-diglyceride synthetase
VERRNVCERALNLILAVKLLILLSVANGTPVLAKRVLGDRYAFPVDGGYTFFDGRPVFGRSKTVRGLVVSVIFTMIAASIVGLGWDTGLVVGGVAMLGDLISSFLKRRMNRPPSSRALGIDQIPESLFPLLACKAALSLSAAEIATVVLVFFAGELVLSRILYRLHIRERPY